MKKKLSFMSLAMMAIMSDAVCRPILLQRHFAKQVLAVLASPLLEVHKFNPKPQLNKHAVSGCCG